MSQKYRSFFQRGITFTSSAQLGNTTTPTITTTLSLPPPPSLDAKPQAGWLRKWK